MIGRVVGSSKSKMTRSRALSAPPKLTDQRNNALAQLPPPLITSPNASTVKIQQPQLRTDEQPTPRDSIVVYTDASCHGNYASGVGIYFGKNHPLNLSQALPGPIHASVFAEIQAALIALERLHAWSGYHGETVIVRSDCKGIVDALRRGSFRDDRYTAELSRLKLAAQRFPNGVQFEHIYGHNGHPGNEEADKLAGEATMGRGRRGRSVSASRRRSVSRNGRGAPNSTVLVRPKAENPSLAIPASTRQQPSVVDLHQERQSRSRTVRQKPSQNKSMQSQSRVAGSKSQRRSKSRNQRRSRSRQMSRSQRMSRSRTRG